MNIELIIKSIYVLMLGLLALGDKPDVYRIFSVPILTIGTIVAVYYLDNNGYKNTTRAMIPLSILFFIMFIIVLASTGLIKPN